MNGNLSSGALSLPPLVPHLSLSLSLSLEEEEEVEEEEEGSVVFFRQTEWRAIDHGAVVQSIVSLTSSLRGQLVKCFTTLYPKTDIFC